MSLVPYKEGSVILDDPSSKSLVIVNPTSGSLEFFQQIQYSDSADSQNQWSKSGRAPLASFICPKCGTEINPLLRTDDADGAPVDEDRQGGERGPSRSIRTRSNLSRNYFQLLERNHKHYALQRGSAKVLPPQHQCFIPENLFIPGYFQKFFKTLSLLGRGARGSVYKVVHMIGDIDLGVFALKKIPIGNDMVWFQKCIREVKALSSLTHRSANLITYNHVWLEMNTACGLVRTMDGKECDQKEEIPCIFILQQYCSGGNLEDFINKEVFQKSQDHQSSDERKKRFLYRRSHPKVALGLSTLQIASIIRDIARGLQELHDIGLIHRDLKPSNCLLLQKIPENLSMSDYIPTIVIGDLGECQLNGESRTASGATGTLEYTAPEIIITGVGRSRPANYNEYTFASDMYSLGMICYFVLFGDLPFQPQLEIMDLKQRIKGFVFNKDSMLRKYEDSSFSSVDPELFLLMEKLLSSRVDQRPSAADVVTFLDAMLSDKFNTDTLASSVKLEADLDMLPEDSNSAVVPLERNFLELEEEMKQNEKSALLDECEQLSNENRFFRRLKSWICHLLNLCLISIILLNARDRTWPTYFALFLFGVSIKSGPLSQRLILAALTVMTTVILINNRSLRETTAYEYIS